ncbi:hypothetical protein CR513_33378, partial [Mucuna pruriens]
MPMTQNQAASSTNEGEEDTLQKLLRVVASPQACSDKHSQHMTARSGGEASPGQGAAYGGHESGRTKGRRASLLDSDDEGNHKKRGGGVVVPTACTLSFWGQLFSEKIDGTLILANFHEVVVEPFDGTQDPHLICKSFRPKCTSMEEMTPLAANCS